MDEAALELPEVAIVGAPNAGKSTLFNRMTRRRVAITGPQPGVTRDRLKGECEHDGVVFTLVDTGGMEPGSEEVIAQQVTAQVGSALAQADVVVFLVDGKRGRTALDDEIAASFRRSGCEPLLAVNKVDHAAREHDLGEFYRLGFGEPVPVSAEHGLGIGELCDAILERLAERPQRESSPEDLRTLTLTGRPNVGKSSLLNRILGENRAIVTDVPGTTRDAIEVPFEHEGQRYRLVDTAGIRRAGKVGGGADRVSVIHAKRRVVEADVAIVLVDGSVPLTHQDQVVAGEPFEARRPMVLAFNKSDLLVGVPEGRNTRLEEADRRFAFARYAPRVFVSAKTGQGIPALFRAIEKVHADASKRVPTGELNRFVDRLGIGTGEAVHGGPRLLYLTQAGVRPPTFVLFVPARERVHFSFRRFMENRLRTEFGFEHSPIRIVVRRKKRP